MNLPSNTTLLTGLHIEPEGNRLEIKDPERWHTWHHPGISDEVLKRIRRWMRRRRRGSPALLSMEELVEEVLEETRRAGVEREDVLAVLDHYRSHPEGGK